MTKSAADHEQAIVPYLAYRDAPAAIEFLHRAFGFEEQFRMPMPDGRVGHAEVAYNGHRVMLASDCEELGFVSPRRLDGVHSQIHVRVDDLEAHYQRAKAAGATIATAPKDQHGMRSYRAMDPEGHRWIFWMPLPDASDSEPMGISGVE
jgi:PhnB protein